MGKFNILVVPSDNIGGVGFYRSTQPHIAMEKMFPDKFSVTIDMNPNFEDLEGFKKYQLIHIHKGLFANDEGFCNFMKFCKENKIATVMDIDDAWKLHESHPQFASQRQYGFDKLVQRNLTMFDYVTTTTPIFADLISKSNKNVMVFPNAIDPEDERFIVEKPKSDKIRVGLIMGSSHENDMNLLEGMTNRLPKDILDKIELVLCGFDLRGTMKVINKDTGEVKERPIEPMESVWYRYEKNLTDNYKIVSDEYKDFLMKFIPNVEYPNQAQEHYKRCWTKDINHYYQHYKNVDILLAPLKETDFNLVKSQLKVIECAFSHTAIVASKFGPYELDLHSMFEKDGVINHNGNAILIDNVKAHKDWAKAIIKLVNNPELIKELQDNLYRDIHETYSLQKVTTDRANFYEELINKVQNA